MIHEDREVLARLARLNQGIAKSVPELLEHQDGGLLPATGLRALADSLSAMADELTRRAEDIERHVV